MLLFIISALLISGFVKFFDLLVSSYRSKIKAWPVSEEKIGSLILQCSLLALLTPSLITYLDAILDSWISQSKRIRFHILSFCLSPLTLWPIFLFLIGVFFFRNNLFYFFDSISYLENDNHSLFYFLADGRFENLLFLGFIVFAFSGIFGQANWFWAWSVILIFGGILSLNGAMAIFLAGLAGIYFHFFLTIMKRKGNSSPLVFKILKRGAGLGIILLAMSLFIFGYFRELLVSSSRVWGSEKLILLFLCWALILLPIFLGLMIWGHFTYQSCLKAHSTSEGVPS